MPWHGHPAFRIAVNSGDPNQMVPGCLNFKEGGCAELMAPRAVAERLMREHVPTDDVDFMFDFPEYIRFSVDAPPLPTADLQRFTSEPRQSHP